MACLLPCLPARLESVIVTLSLMTFRIHRSYIGDDRKLLLLIGLSSELAQALKYGDACKIEVFTAVTVKNAFFWDVTPCRSCK
jgi:hypothetical protein